MLITVATQRVLLQLPRFSSDSPSTRQHLVADQQFARLVAANQPVRIAIVRQAKLRAVLAHRLLHLLRMRAPAIRVDVHAIRLHVQRDHLRAQPRKTRGVVSKAAPLPASTTTFTPFKSTFACAPIVNFPKNQPRIPRHRMRNRLHAPDLVPRHALAAQFIAEDQLLQLHLQRIVQLQPLPLKILSPLSSYGLCEALMTMPALSFICRVR